MSEIFVDSYGLHEAGGMWFLHQKATGSQNVISSEIKSPYKPAHVLATGYPGGITDFDIQLKDCLEDYAFILDDPIMREFLPIPYIYGTQNQAIYIGTEGHDSEYIRRIYRLSCCFQQLFHFNMLNNRDFLKVMRVANHVPLVMGGFTPEATRRLNGFSQEMWGAPRKFIAIGSKDVPPPPEFIRFDFKLTPTWKKFAETKIPYRQLGSSIVRRFMEDKDVLTRGL